MKRLRKIGYLVLAACSLFGLSIPLVISGDNIDKTSMQTTDIGECITLANSAVELYPGEIDKLCPFDGVGFKESYFNGECLNLKINIDSPANENDIRFIWSIKLKNGDVINIDNKTNILNNFLMRKEFDEGTLIITALFETTSSISFPIKVIDKLNVDIDSIDDSEIKETNLENIVVESTSAPACERAAESEITTNTVIEEARCFNWIHNNP